MKIIESTSTMDFSVILKLKEEEARALEAITLYGIKEFLETFYKHLGKSYLQPHEEGVKVLFETIKSELPKHLKKFDKIREEWKKQV